MSDTPAGFTLWFTGLSGAGKSTLAEAMRDEILVRGRRVEILDGDEVRTNLSKGLGFSKEDRDTNIRRIGYVARLLSRNGVVVIAAAISPYRDVRAEVRSAHEAVFVEAFIDCSLDELVRRDRKGLYAKALRGELPNFTGVSDPYEAPQSPEIHLHSDLETVDQSRTAIVKWLESHGLLTRPAPA
jgi:adenylyl-sulfate kinase